MSKRLFIGPAGCGKSHQVLDEFENTIRQADPLSQKHLLILPSAEHTERMVTLLLSRGLPGFFHRRVTTLSRFTSQAFGIGEEKFISGSTRLSLLREILQREDWDYFRDIVQTPGFLHLVARFILELKESNVSVQGFRERMNHLRKFQPELAPKYEAFAAIYETYGERLTEEGLWDRQDALKLYKMKKNQEASSRTRYEKIWLDGFFDFTPLQLDYLKELLEITDDVTITLTVDGEKRRPALFEPIQATLEKLKSMGFEVKVFPNKNKRSAVPALVYLERELFSGNAPKKWPEPAAAIQTYEAVGMQGEVEMMARSIRQWYQTGDYRFSDFAILLRQVSGYEATLQSTFAKYGIPLEIHERERLKLAPLFQPFIQLIRIFQEDWKRADVMDFLKSSYVRTLGEEPKSYASISDLEHRAFREGVLASRELWMEFAGDHPGLRCLDALQKDLEGASTLDAIKAIFMKAIDETFSMVQFSESSETDRRDEASLERLDALFEEIRLQFSIRDKEVTWAGFADAFLRLVELDLYSLHYPGKNRVQVYDVSLARQKEYRVVFVGGLLEKSFPVQMKQDPLLSDWERQLFNQGQEFSLKEFLPRQSMERYLFYLAVTRAKEKLVLSFPHVDREGKESLPSFYIDEVRNLFAGHLIRKRQDLSRPYPEVMEAGSLRELETSVMGNSQQCEKEEEPFYLQATQKLLALPQSRKRIERAFYQIENLLEDERIAAGDFFRTQWTSPTRLEEYGKCHFKYFAGRVLKLQDPREEINIKRKGIILHQVLESLMRDHPVNNLPFKSVQPIAMKEFKKALNEHPLSFEKRYQEILELSEMQDMLMRFLEHELARIKNSEIKPRYFEFAFGVGDEYDAPPLEIEVPEGKVSIVGKIDRVDVDSEHKYALILDYKRTAQFKKDDLDFGIALQLPVYLKAVQEKLGLKPIGGELYSIKDRKKRGFYHKTNSQGLVPLSGRSIAYSDKGYEATIEHSLRFVQLYISEMKKMSIEVKPRLCDSFCPYVPVCRIEKWRLPLIREEIQDEDVQRVLDEKGVWM